MYSLYLFFSSHNITKLRWRWNAHAETYFANAKVLIVGTHFWWMMVMVMAVVVKIERSGAGVKTETIGREEWRDSIIFITHHPGGDGKGRGE